MLTRRHRVRRLRHNASIMAINVAGIGVCALGSAAGAMLGWDVAQTAVNLLAEPWKAHILVNPLSYGPAALGLGVGLSLASAVTQRFNRATTRLFPQATPLAHEIIDALHDSTRLMGQWALAAGAVVTGIETGIALGVYGATGVTTLMPIADAGTKLTVLATYVGGLATGIVGFGLAAEAAFHGTEKLRGNDNRVYLTRNNHRYTI